MKFKVTKDKIKQTKSVQVTCIDEINVQFYHKFTL